MFPPLGFNGICESQRRLFRLIMFVGERELCQGSRAAVGFPVHGANTGTLAVVDAARSTIAVGLVFFW